MVDRINRHVVGSGFQRDGVGQCARRDVDDVGAEVEGPGGHRKTQLLVDRNIHAAIFAADANDADHGVPRGTAALPVDDDHGGLEAHQDPARWNMHGQTLFRLSKPHRRHRVDLRHQVGDAVDHVQREQTRAGRRGSEDQVGCFIHDHRPATERVGHLDGRL